MPPFFVVIVYRPPDVPSLTDDSDFITDLEKHSVNYDTELKWAI